MFGFFTKRYPKEITAHVLDPKEGYMKLDWLIGKDISTDMVNQYSDGMNVYVINVYEAGAIKQIICRKDLWLKAKAQFSSIDEMDMNVKEHTSNNSNQQQISNSNEEESDTDTLFVDVNMFNKTAILISGSKMVQVNGAIFATLILALKSDGWDGDDLFVHNTGILKLGRHQVTKESATHLADLLKLKINFLSEEELSEEAEKPIRDLLDIANLGSFTIDLVDN
jgi:hypothetical protein